MTGFQEVLKIAGTNAEKNDENNSDETHAAIIMNKQRSFMKKFQKIFLEHARWNFHTFAFRRVETGSKSPKT